MALPPTTYPRTYRVAVGWRVLFMTIGSGLTLVCLVMVWKIITIDRRQETLVSKIITVLGILVVIGGLAFYSVVGPLHDRVVLTNERIIVYQLLRSRGSLRYDEIAGRREVRGKNGYTQLVPNRPDLNSLKIDDGYSTDQAYDAWLASIPVLDS